MGFCCFCLENLTLRKTCNVLELWNFGARKNSRYHLALCKYVKKLRQLVTELVLEFKYGSSESTAISAL